MKKQNTVEEIHEEFYSSTEQVLIEANEIIKNDTTAATMKKLGFKRIGIVQEMERKSMIARWKETIQYYQQKYPLYKFILPEEVQRICNKYGLFFGDVTQYKGVVPDKNVQEILRFQVKGEDRAESDGRTFFTSSHWGSPFEKFFLNNGTWCEEKVEEDGAKKETMVMKICAGKDKFELSGWEVKDGYKLVPDPIVLQPVKGGYLIVTAWGDEAADETVVNENMN